MKIKKVSVAPIDPITGSVVDTTNIDDKTSNTYSANVIDNLLGSQGWKYATVNTEYFTESGFVRYIQVGKLVIVVFADLIIGNAIEGSEKPLVSGLPIAKYFTAFMISGTDGSADHLFRMVLPQGDTTIRSWYHNKGANPYVMYYGQLIYLTD